MPSQFPAFRLMVAHQMEAYRDRIARRIRQEAAKRGESAPDLAHALGIYPQTAERWFRGERTPQRRHRTQLAEHWEIAFEELEPDLFAEERELRDQLNRIEQKLDQLLDHFDLAELEELAAGNGQDDARPGRRSSALPGEGSSAPSD